MRLLKDLRDWLALRRHLSDPWAFVRSRHAEPEGPFCDVRLRDGGAVRLRAGTADRQVFNDVFARDEYGLAAYRAGELGTVIDIGAHVGTFAVRVAPLARRVISCEPFPPSYDLLVENVRRFPHVTPCRQAVAGRRAAVPLFLSSDPCNNSMFGSHADGPPGQAITVEAVTLANLFERHAIGECDLLKLDCEGAEYEILHEVGDLLRRIRRITLEYHPLPGAPEACSGEGLAGRLESAGHRVRLRPRSRHRGMGVLFSERRG